MLEQPAIGDDGRLLPVRLRIALVDVGLRHSPQTGIIPPPREVEDLQALGDRVLVADVLQTFDPDVLDVQGGTGGQVRAGALIANQSSLDGSEELLVNGQSKLKGNVTITTGTFRHESGGNARIEAGIISMRLPASNATTLDAM